MLQTEYPFPLLSAICSLVYPFFRELQKLVVAIVDNDHLIARQNEALVTLWTVNTECKQSIILNALKLVLKYFNNKITIILPASVTVPDGIII